MPLKPMHYNGGSETTYYVIHRRPVGDMVSYEAATFDAARGWIEEQSAGRRARREEMLAKLRRDDLSDFHNYQNLTGIERENARRKLILDVQVDFADLTYNIVRETKTYSVIES